MSANYRGAPPQTNAPSALSEQLRQRTEQAERQNATIHEQEQTINSMIGQLTATRDELQRVKESCEAIAGELAKSIVMREEIEQRYAQEHVLRAQAEAGYALLRSDYNELAQLNQEIEARYQESERQLNLARERIVVLSGQVLNPGALNGAAEGEILKEVVL